MTGAEKCAGAAFVKKMKMLQESLNRFMIDRVFPPLKRMHDRYRSGHKRRKLKRQITELENKHNLHKTPRDAVAAMHCKMNTREGDPSQPIPGLFHIDCAFNWCTRCPERKMHKLVNMLISKDKLDPITFNTHENVISCTKASLLSPAGVKVD